MKKILIVNSNYYKKISSSLVKEAKMTLAKNNFETYIIETPGIFEIPVTISKYIKKYDAFIALGCVIKGETPHFELICKSTFESISKLSINYNKPIGNGIITALNMKQAKARSLNNLNTKKPNKGLEAAKAVITVLKNEPKKT